MVGWVEKEGPPSSGWMILVFQYFISWFCKPRIAAPSFHSETRSDVAFLVFEVFLNSLSLLGLSTILRPSRLGCNANEFRQRVPWLRSASTPADVGRVRGSSLPPYALRRLPTGNGWGNFGTFYPTACDRAGENPEK